MVATPSRVVLRADIRIGDREIVGHTLDVSERGALVQVDDEAPLGARVEVELSLSGLLDRPCALGAELVARRIATGPGEPATWELCWDHADADERQRLTDLLARVRAGGEDRGRLRILLVEDSAMTRQVFELGVTRLLGHRVGALILDHATDAEAAWNKLVEGEYEVAIVDCLLPGIQGWELIRKLRARQVERSIAVVAMSVGGEEVRRQALEAGADLFVHKPVVVADLLTSLERLGRPRGQP